MHYFLLHVLLAALYGLTAQLKTESDKNRVFGGIALATLAAGAYGILQYNGIDFISWSTQWGSRPSSTFGNPNFAAGWWIMTLPIFTAKFLASKNNKRWFFLALSLLILANLYLGKTRGAWLAAALSLLLSGGIWFSVHYKLSAKKNLALAMLGLVLFGSAAFWGYRKAGRSADRSVLERIFKWKTAEMMMRDHPAFGVGAGNLKVHFALYQEQVKKKMNIPLKATSESNVHNEYLQIGSELGAVGLLAYLSIFLVWFAFFLKTFPHLPQEKKIERIGIAGAVLSFIFFSLTNFPLHIVPNACLIFFLLGLQESGDRPEESALPPQPARWGVRSAAAAVYVLLVWQVLIPPLKADYLRLQAQQTASAGDFRAAIGLYTQTLELDYYRSERSAYELGECYRAIKQYNKAIKAYEVSVRLRNYGEVYNNIGNCYYLLHNKAKAAANWTIALRMGLPESGAQLQTEKNLKLLGKF